MTTTDSILAAMLVKLCEIAERLTETRDLLSGGLLAAEASETEVCAHPDDKRVDISTPGDMHHWICSVCRFDSKAATAMN